MHDMAAFCHFGVKLHNQHDHNSFPAEQEGHFFWLALLFFAFFVILFVDKIILNPIPFSLSLNEVIPSWVLASSDFF